MEAVSARSEASSSVTQVTEVDATTSAAPVLRLRLKNPKKDRKVGWREDTVDNENLNRKKSKCCCIYKKPAVFGESSSEDDEECENCFGHPEKRRRNKKNPAPADENGEEHTCEDDSCSIDQNPKEA